MAKWTAGAAVAGIAALTLASPALAGVIVTPEQFAGVDFSGGNVIPFGDSESISRYQQVTNSSAFASISGPILVTSIAFRRDENDGFPAPAFEFTYSNLSVGMSTIDEGNWSSYLDGNRGADYISVFTGPLTISVPAQSGPGLRPWSVVIELATPFLYDPSKGDLMWEVQNFGGNFPVFAPGHTPFILDYAYTPDGLMARAATFPYADGPNYPYGWTSQSGVVTQFTFADVEVPEPGSFPVVVAGLFAIGLLGRSRFVTQRPQVKHTDH